MKTPWAGREYAKYRLVAEAADADAPLGSIELIMVEEATQVTFATVS